MQSLMLPINTLAYSLINTIRQWRIPIRSYFYVLIKSLFIGLLCIVFIEPIFLFWLKGKGYANKYIYTRNEIRLLPDEWSIQSSFSTTEQKQHQQYPFVLSSQDTTTDTISNAEEVCTSSNETAVVCTMVKDMEPYIDEWVDYHFALGFCKFYIYVNEDYFYLQQWSERKGPHIELIHFPGEALQNTAFQNCAEKVQFTTNHTWVGFFDIDEFLVFRNWTHTNVIDFLQIYCKNGSIGINWVMFGPCRTDEYSPIPILKRCQVRTHTIWKLIKTIAKVADMNLSKPIDNPHYVYLKDGTYRYDTLGKKLVGRHQHFNNRKPANVSVFYHYHYKSRKEYIQKRMRGRADVVHNHTSNQDLIREAENGIYDSVTFNTSDDSAWWFLKTHVPKYSYFDKFDLIYPTINNHSTH